MDNGDVLRVVRALDLYATKFDQMLDSAMEADAYERMKAEFGQLLGLQQRLAPQAESTMADLMLSQTNAVAALFIDLNVRIAGARRPSPDVLSRHVAGHTKAVEQLRAELANWRRRA
jgi:hypothetical protein